MPSPVEVVKMAAAEAVQAGKPTEFRYGTVSKENPLEITVDQKVTLKGDMLILTRNVTNYYVDVEIRMNTETITHGHRVIDTYQGGGTAVEMEHNHPVIGTKKVLIKNGLIVGDKVILLREQGGKKFIVLDRLEPIPKLGGEWI